MNTRGAFSVGSMDAVRDRVLQEFRVTEGQLEGDRLHPEHLRMEEPLRGLAWVAWYRKVEIDPLHPTFFFV